MQMNQPVDQPADDPHDHDHETHRSHRGGWLRAAVLGANDGLLSTSSLVIGVAAGDVGRSVILLTGIAALVSGGLSMAAGEYASVSSQRDAERADLDIERRALDAHPEAELNELTAIYRGRGLSPELAREVATQLHDHDALVAHARDELGLAPDDLANPLQAATVSALSFALGALVPVLAMALFGSSIRSLATALVTLFGLACTGAVAARLGGAHAGRDAGRLVALGALAMVATSLIGSLVGTSL